MKKTFLIIAAFVVILYCAYGLHLIYSENVPIKVDQYRVLIVYNSADQRKAPYGVEAYQSVLTEEGVPWETVEIIKLIKTPAKHMAKNIPAIIFPDTLMQGMPEETLVWVKDYLNQGGNLAVIYDPGIKKDKSYREKALLSDFVGVNYMNVNQYKGIRYTTGQLKFNSKADADYFQIPMGKLNENYVLSGYFYGGLNYPIVRTQKITAAPPEKIFAQTLTAQGEQYPAITLKKYGQGNVLYVNLPLGYLKSFSDDLPLRAFLRTFLFQIIKMPHLVNTNQGKGKLVINWHVDSNGEWKNIPAAIDNKYLDKELRSSIHITAGDFRDKQGDNFGFDACGKGRIYAQQYLPYGIIGSHGGWAHNWFAEKLKKNRLRTYEIRRYIKKNRKCLESITGYTLLEYSAPVGAHPQPVTTNILEDMGFNSYYYVGDSGSVPNRTFSDGKIISEKVIAFPVLPNGKYASLYEMKKAEIAEDDVQKWLMNIVDYVIEKRTTRLFYSHINDIFNYPRAVSNFLQYVKIKQARGELQIEPMSEIANFFLRFIKTQYSFKNQENGLSILLRNTEGLKGITVAIPKHIYQVKAEKNVSQSKDKNYYYLTVQEDVKEKVIMAYRH